MHDEDMSDQIRGAEDREPRWRRQPEAKRQRLIDATITVLARDGLSEFSLERVAGQAELSAGLIRHHFGGRAGLLCAAYQKIAEHFLEAIDGALEIGPQDSIERLKTYLDVVRDPFAIGYEPASAWFALWNEARDDEDLHQINRSFQAQYLERITSLVRGLASDWDETDIAIEARSLIALTDGLWQERMIDPDAHSRELSHQACMRYVARLLNALNRKATCASSR